MASHLRGSGGEEPGASAWHSVTWAPPPARWMGPAGAQPTPGGDSWRAELGGSGSQQGHHGAWLLGFPAARRVICFWRSLASHGHLPLNLDWSSFEQVSVP